jgi:proteasome lid subunit RPN8/RPN11
LACSILLGALCRHLRLLARLPGPERVGYLLGTARAGSIAVHAFFSVRNVEASPAGFTADPLDVVAAHKAAWAIGLDVVGVFHTHPHGRPEPSKRDIEGMRLWPIPWVIAGGSGGVRAFKLLGGVLVECLVECSG